MCYVRFSALLKIKVQILMNADILLSAMWELLSDGLYISVRLRLIIPVMLYWFWKWTLLTWPTMEDEMSWLIQSWICSEGHSGSVKAIVGCGRNGVSNLDAPRNCIYLL